MSSSKEAFAGRPSWLEMRLWSDLKHVTYQGSPIETPTLEAKMRMPPELVTMSPALFFLVVW